MLQVTNGSVTISVTKGAYKGYYAQRGFWPVDGAGGVEEAGVVTTHPTPDTDHSADSSQQEMANSEDESEEDGEYEDEGETDLSEIPLGEMSFDQLCEYADQLDLDRDGIRSKKELRALIREYLNN